MYVLDTLATHVAYIVSEDLKRAPRVDGSRVVIEPSVEAELGWVRERPVGRVRSPGWRITRLVISPLRVLWGQDRVGRFRRRTLFGEGD